MKENSTRQDLSRIDYAFTRAVQEMHRIILLLTTVHKNKLPKCKSTALNLQSDLIIQCTLMNIMK